MTHEIKKQLEHLDELKAELDSHRPLPQEVVANLREDMTLRFTYHSNAIEGNTLTLLETKVVLEGLTVGGKTMREHLEAINHKEAINYIEELANPGELLNEKEIKSIHHLVLKNIDDPNAGAYRKTNVIISGASHRPPGHLEVPSQMKEFVEWYAREQSRLHPVILASRVHSEFVKIHPFIDGNGRTSRLLMNLELLKAGFPAAILPVEKRLDYYKALDLAHTQNHYDDFDNLIISIVKESFEPYWHTLGISRA